uniref:PKD_channel domain-containing protein n=1 Tax=Macrostomum lignano TaxID=282301 RepID=A0A1I8JE70_9PLAT
KNNFDGFKVISKNITSMDFGPISSLISNGLNSTQAVYLFDLLSIWSPTEVNTTFTGMTGSYDLAPDGTVSRQNWFMYFYKGLGEQRERIGNWSSAGEFHFQPALVRTTTDEMLKRELNLNVFRVVTVL